MDEEIEIRDPHDAFRPGTEHWGTMPPFPVPIVRSQAGAVADPPRVGLECAEPICGTLELMVSQGMLSLHPLPGERASVKAVWWHDGRRVEGYGSSAKAAMIDCCEQQFVGEKRAEV